MQRKALKLTVLCYLLLAVFAVRFSYAQQQELLPLARNKILHVMYVDGAGLGNRIKKTVSYLRYYRPKHLNLYWPAEGWVSARFLDLFAPQWNVSITEYNSPYLINNFPYPQPLVEYVAEYILLVARDEFKSGEHMFIDMQYNRIPPEIIKLYLPYFKALKPSVAVKKRIDEVKLPENAVAVQIRNAPDWQKVFNANEAEQSFFKYMDTYPVDTIFFLSAMNKEAAAPFYKRYPGRIIELPNKDYHSMIDAAADMFILGTTKEALYQFGSTFGEVAWWLGGAKAKVTVVGKNAPSFNAPQFKVLEEFGAGF